MVITKEDFCHKIEKKWAELQSSHELCENQWDDISFIDCVLIVCQDNLVEPELIGSLVNRSIREKIEIEAKKKNLLKCKLTTSSLSSFL